MAKKPEIPTSGGSYIVKSDGKLQRVEATQPPPAVQVAEEAKSAPAPAAPPAITSKE